MAKAVKGEAKSTQAPAKQANAAVAAGAMPAVPAAKAPKKHKGREVVAAQPVGAFDELDRLMERVFDAPFGRGWLRPFAWERLLPGAFARTEAWVPAIDLIERDDALVVRAEVPGVEKKDLDVSLTPGAVTIQGRVSRDEKQERGQYYRREITRGAFARTVALPAGVDTENVKASFKDGVLELVLPKTRKAAPRKVMVD